MSKIEIGQRVKVSHKPEHDGAFAPFSRLIREAAHGKTGHITGVMGERGVWVSSSFGEAPFRPDELTPIEATLPEPSAPVKCGIDRALRVAQEAHASVVAALELRVKAAEVEAAAARASADAALERRRRALEAADKARADLETLVSAAEVRTHAPPGTMSVAGLAAALRADDRGESADIAALAREQSCHRGTKEALAKLRAKHENARREFAKLRETLRYERSWVTAQPGWNIVERAFADEPAKDPEPVAGPWVEIKPGEWRRQVEGFPRLFAMAIDPHEQDVNMLVWIVFKPWVGGIAERGLASHEVGATHGGTDEERLKAAMAACDAAARRVGWTLRDAPKVEPADVERKIAVLNTAVENLARHAEDLERRLSEVQDPEWFAARFREHMAPKPAVEARPRMSWQWNESSTNGWLCTADTRVAGAHEGNDGWYWWVRSVNEEMPRRVGPVSKEEAIAKAEAATRQWADIVPGKP